MAPGLTPAHNWQLLGESWPAELVNDHVHVSRLAAPQL